MTAGTGLSRITGFARLVAVVYVLGFSRTNDTYTLANTLPNIIYDLVLGAILAGFLVPIVVDELASRDEDEAWRAISAIVTVGLVLLGVASILLAVAAPLVIHLYTLGHHGLDAHDQQAVATTLLRLFAPQVLFYGAFALMAAVLNARRVFFAPSVLPVVNNVIVIGMVLALREARNRSSLVSLHALAHDHVIVVVLGLGTTAGVATQVVGLLPSLRQARAKLSFLWAPTHPAVQRFARLAGWTLAYAVTNQVSLAVVLWLANRRRGGVSIYQSTYQLFQLPYGIFGVSVLVALTPALAERWARADSVGFRDRLSQGLRSLSLLMVPAAAGYMVLARPIAILLFEHGSVTARDAAAAGDVTALFAVGLPPFAAYLMVLRGYLARHDTRTPFLINAAENGLNIGLALALYPLLGVQGLALSFSLAYLGGLVVAGWALRRDIGGFETAGAVRTSVRAVAAAAIMAGVVSGLSRVLPGEHGFLLAVRLAICVTAGVAIYAVAAGALGNELGDVLRGRMSET